MDSNVLKASYFDYSDANRVNTITQLFASAKTERTAVETKWKTLDAMYSAHTKTLKRFEVLIDDNKITDNRATEPSDIDNANGEYSLTDPYIQIESQLDPTVPEPTFIGKDDETDYEKAKQREYVVKHIMGVNDIASKKTRLERTMRIYGDVFVKLYFDTNKRLKADDIGEICAEVIPPDAVYPDPTAETVEECEYIDFVYYMHRQKAKRMWRDEFKKAKVDINTITTESRSATEVIGNPESDTATTQYDVQIIEHWYKDDDGDICVSMLIGDQEFKHIKKYWRNTRTQNKDFPFYQFYGLRSQKGFWNVSELEPIAPLCEIENKQINMALQNNDLMNNDVWIVEENSLEENTEITNEPGGVISYHKGATPPKRAGGISRLEKAINDILFIQEQIQRTNRNFDTNQGKQSDTQKTATELSLMNSNYQRQATVKDFDPLQCWKRLFIGMDKAALEFYNDDKMIFIGVPENEIDKKNQVNSGNAVENYDPKKGNIFFTFNSDSLRKEVAPSEEVIQDALATGKEPEPDYYYPLVDCEVSPTNGIEKSKSFTIQALQNILGMVITAENYKTAIMLVKQLGLPQSDEIINHWKEMFELQLTPEEEDMLNKLPPEQQAVLRANPILIGRAMADATRRSVQQPMTQ